MILSPYCTLRPVIQVHLNYRRVVFSAIAVWQLKFKRFPA
jgi:hypothetical protein